MRNSVLSAAVPGNALSPRRLDDYLDGGVNFHRFLFDTFMFPCGFSFCLKMLMCAPAGLDGLQLC